MSIIEVGLFQTKAGADFLYYNPNNSGVTISCARGDVYLDNKYIGRFELADKASVKKEANLLFPPF